MAVLLATGTSAQSSADFTLTGETTTLFLTSTTAEVPQNASVALQIKGANGLYYPVGGLSTMDPIQVLSGPGTYRVSRPAGLDVGVDRV